MLSKMVRFHFLWLNYFSFFEVIFHCTYTPYFFIHSSTNAHIDCFHILVNINSAAMNIRVWISFKISVFYLDKILIKVFYHSSIFNFLKELHTVLHSGCTIFYSEQQCIRVNFANMLVVFFIIAILIDVRWYISVVWLSFP